MHVPFRLVASLPRHCCSSSTTLSFSTFDGIHAEKLQAALDYCVKIVQERDYENYLAILQMTKSAQPRLFSVLALNAEIASLRHKIKRGSGLAGINQLTFWKDALQMFGQSAQKTLLPRQPVMTALSAFGSREDVPLLLQLVSARQQTLGDRPFADVHALESNARALYGTIIRLQMHALHDATAATQDGERRQQMLEYEDCQRAVDAMACAVGILTLLRATVLLLRDGVMLLPQDLTALHGVSVEMAYRKPNSLKEVVRDLCEISVRHLRTARCPSCFDSVRPALRPALLTCGLRADHVLTLLNTNDFNLLDVRLHQRHPMSAWKLWWRNRCKRY
ncbi:hypothetical protein GPALN_006127 [Globodera pallida]|nr:hypothetical protein GPALN_006127 [Globodera pallida]